MTYSLKASTEYRTHRPIRTAGISPVFVRVKSVRSQMPSARAACWGLRSKIGIVSWVRPFIVTSSPVIIIRQTVTSHVRPAVAMGPTRLPRIRRSLDVMLETAFMGRGRTSIHRCSEQSSLPRPRGCGPAQVQHWQHQEVRRESRHQIGEYTRSLGPTVVNITLLHFVSLCTVRMHQTSFHLSIGDSGDLAVFISGIGHGLPPAVWSGRSERSCSHVCHVCLKSCMSYLRYVDWLEGYRGPMQEMCDVVQIEGGGLQDLGVPCGL